ncbi:MAG: hypothetical protein GC162_11970 [Planctomycetes bacterium]|nr:hypothetical protein [Planctomycetota bacterium]
MLPYSSKRQVGDDKIERSVQVWVDKDGRSMTQTVRRTADANGVMHEYRGTYSTDGKLFESEVPVSGNGTADSVIETMSKSPMLHQLFTNGLLPALEAVRTKQEAKPSAPSQTPEASGSPAGTDKP